MTATASDPFFWNDWQGDPALRLCSMAAQGLWMRMLCICAESKPKGYVLIRGKSPKSAELAVIVGAPLKLVNQCLNELENAGVFSRNRKQIIYCRRMVRKTKLIERSSKGGKIGGRVTHEKGLGIHATPGKRSEQIPEPISDPHARAPSPSPSPSPKEPEGREPITSNQTRAEKPARGGAGRGTRWPAGDQVPQDWITEGEMRRVEHGLAGISLHLEAEQFVNFWASKSGANATKVDWHLTWINWCLKAEGPRNGHGKPESPHRQEARIAAELIAEFEAGDRARTHHPPDGAREPLLASRHDRGPAQNAAAPDVRGPGRPNGTADRVSLRSVAPQRGQPILPDERTTPRPDDRPLRGPETTGLFHANTAPGDHPNGRGSPNPDPENPREIPPQTEPDIAAEIERWGEAGAQLANSLGPAIFHAWFRRAFPKNRPGGGTIVLCPSSLVAERLNEKFRNHLEAVFETPIEIVFKPEPEPALADGAKPNG